MGLVFAMYDCVTNSLTTFAQVLLYVLLYRYRIKGLRKFAERNAYIILAISALKSDLSSVRFVRVSLRRAIVAFLISYSYNFNVHIKLNTIVPWQDVCIIYICKYIMQCRCTDISHKPQARVCQQLSKKFRLANFSKVEGRGFRLYQVYLNSLVR